MVRARLLYFVFCATMLASSAGAQTVSSQEVVQLKGEIESLKAMVKQLQDRKLTCNDGKSVEGKVDQWSPWSVCPLGAVATGLSRVDIQGAHALPINHVNDFQCNDKGCRAWCIGNPCEVVARCCQ